MEMEKLRLIESNIRFERRKIIECTGQLQSRTAAFKEKILKAQQELSLLKERSLKTTEDKQLTDIRISQDGWTSKLDKLHTALANTELNYRGIIQMHKAEIQQLEDELKDIITESGNTEPAMSHGSFQGTVKSSPSFNPNADCEVLKKAMKGLGCDEKAVINVLCYRSNAQRQQIRHTFKTMYGKDLVTKLISELRCNFADLIVALMYTPGEYDAHELRYAMEGAEGTTESTLIEIMATRTNAEIGDIKTAYRTMFHEDLQQSLVSDTSGYFKRLLVSLCNGGRNEAMHVDPAQAKKSAQDLYSAGVKRWGTDEITFNAVLCSQSYPQLQAVFEEYRNLAGHDIEHAIKAEFSGEIQAGLLALVKSARNTPAFFAERCYNAIFVGMIINDRSLIRAVVTRCEKDMVQIKQEFQRMYGKTLESFIDGDTSGKYKDGLMALVRGY